MVERGHCGVAPGVGRTLYEEMLYDDEEQPLTSTLTDYLLPAAMETPHIGSPISDGPKSSWNEWRRRESHHLSTRRDRERSCRCLMLDSNGESCDLADAETVWAAIRGS